MENVIVERLAKIISEREKSFLNDEKFKSFEKAIKDFDILIEKGFAKKRK